jgi:hypothetical protein
MKKLWLIITALACLTSCNWESEKEITRFSFPFKKNLHASYFSRSQFFAENGNIEIEDSAFFNYDIIEEKKGGEILSYTWTLLPGSQEKSVPDTLFTNLEPTGYYVWYNKGLFDSSSAKRLLFPLPLKKSAAWSSYFLNIPASSICINLDTIIQTKAGKFSCFRVDSEFYPDFHNGILSDTINYRVKGIISDYYSLKAGKIYSKAEYFTESRLNDVKGYKFLSNETYLVELK